jgi:ankyrin repeat protein
MTPLFIAARHGHLEVVQCLVRDGGVAVNQAAMYIAAYQGHLEVVQWLVRDGGAAVNQADEDGWTPLVIAAQQGHLKVVQWLVQEGGAAVNHANNGYGRTPLFRAAQQGHLEVVQWFRFRSATVVRPQDSVWQQPAVRAALERGVADRAWLTALGPEVTAALFFPPGLAEIVSAYASL